MNIETTMIKFLKDHGFKAFGNVPQTKPDDFVTVERTGGGFDNVVIDRPTVAVQTWSTSRMTASELAYRVRDCLLTMVGEPNVCKVSVNSVYNFPDYESGMSRYQIVLNLVIMEE